MQKYLIKVPAKINMFLHVVGKNLRGYHIIESVFAFVSLYDTLEVTIGTEKRGVKFFKSPDINMWDNTVQRSLSYLEGKRSKDVVDNVYVKVFKNIPVSAGLAGGSADAAGLIRLLSQLWNISEWDAGSIALRVGSDVPVCMKSKTAFVRGVGEHIELLSDTFFPKYVLLVGPNEGLRTKSVFSAFNVKEFSKSIKHIPQSDSEWLKTVKESRNDLTDVAMSIIPEIGKILNVLKVLDGCCMSRMSGSGAMCFALFDEKKLLSDAARYLRIQYPEWLIYETELITSEGDGEHF